MIYGSLSLPELSPETKYFVSSVGVSEDFTAGGGVGMASPCEVAPPEPPAKAIIEGFADHRNLLGQRGSEVFSTAGSKDEEARMLRLDGGGEPP